MELRTIAPSLLLVKAKEPLAVVPMLTETMGMRVMQMEEPKQVVTTTAAIKQAMVALVMVITATEVAAMLLLPQMLHQAHPSKPTQLPQRQLHRAQLRQPTPPEEVEEAGSPRASGAKVKEVDKETRNNSSSKSSSSSRSNSNSNVAAPSTFITHELSSKADPM